MHLIVAHIRKFWRYCLFVAVAYVFSACVYDSSLCLPDADTATPGDAITIEFSMLTRNAESVDRSRALLPPSGTPEIGFGAENYLDLDNLTFLLFDDQQKMLRTFRPEVSVADDATGPYVKYRVRAFLHDNYFLKATSEYIRFTIVVLANYESLSPENFSYYIGQKLEDIFARDKVGTFAAPVSNNVGNNCWIPTIAPVAGQGIGHIPMAGMQTFTVAMTSLRASTPDKPYQLSNGAESKYINMLRALAKIEIVDKIGVDYYSIEKVELVGHTTRGSILPAFGQWTGLETQYVTNPSIPASATYIGSEPAAGLNIVDADAILNFFADEDATDAREDGCRVYSCYLTEYDPLHRGSAPAMWMRMTVEAKDRAESVLYRLEVAPYVEGRPGEPLQILRNNIYRYVITGVNDISLDIQPFANLELSFGFGLLRDARGDLMVVPDKDGNYPEYFEDFAETHGYPQVVNDDGSPTGKRVDLSDGDYYAIVVGESGEMSDAEIWVKDREGCRVLSNFGNVHEGQDCSARWVESFFGNNESEKFLKDRFGYRRVYHFDNHNSIVRHPQVENLLFCFIENFQQEGETRKYYEVESWDNASKTGWIINKNDDGTEVGFQEIKSDGTLGETQPIDN